MLKIAPSTYRSRTYPHRCRIEGDIPPDALRDIKAQLSYIDASAGILRCEFSSKPQTFPRGLLPRVEHILRFYEIPYAVVPDHRPRIAPVDPSHMPPLRTYQRACLAALDQHPWGIIDSPPRSGKTLMLAYDWDRRGRPPAVWFCDTIVLAEQTQRMFREYFPDAEIGLVGDGRCEVPNTIRSHVNTNRNQFTVMTVQSAYRALPKAKELPKRFLYDPDEQPPEHHDRIREVIGSAEHVIRDEAHHATGVMDAAILRNTEATTRRFASGTPWHTESQGIALESVTGPVIWSVGYEHLFERGYLIRPDVFIVRLPMVRHPSGTPWSTIYKNYVVESELRNGIIASFCDWLNRRGMSVCVLVRQIKHGDILQRPGWDVLYGSQRCFDREHRQSVLERLGRKEVLTVISTVMGEGVDCPSLDAVVNAAGEKSAIAVMQRMRCLTPAPGKERALVLDFEDHAKYLTRHAKERRELYEHFGFRIWECDADQLHQSMAKALCSV